ncbi:carbohydrate-binding module family 13 protein [Fusarium austroafricanum]|uniref:Carbohydrate-binding module family 13 protein n=1 Tax=Fusarium austroafricanum TaxID=2364996 RepID=A0A8H4NRZ1_9HYPO|nr:carbohydrate-binding module family 13 protein [Fusarium austroafricanum]
MALLKRLVETISGSTPTPIKITYHMINPNDLDGKTVALVNFATGNAIELKDAIADPPSGTPCIGSQSHLGETQQWKFVKYKRCPDDQPQFRLQNIGAPQRAMDLYKGGIADGTHITGWEYSGFDNHQLWCIRIVGYFKHHGTVVNCGIENISAGTFVTLQSGNAKDGLVAVVPSDSTKTNDLGGGSNRIVGQRGSLASLSTDQLWILKVIL